MCLGQYIVMLTPTLTVQYANTNLSNYTPFKTQLIYSTHYWWNYNFIDGTGTLVPRWYC